MSVSLDIDQESQLRSIGIDTAAVLPDPFAQRIEVKRLKRSTGFRVTPLVRDEQLAIDQPDIDFDAAKSLVQSVEERAIVEVVVVRVGTGQRNDCVAKGREVQSE